ncbi:MAG: hypothetical protein NVSMB42_23760 [Herpetosiphon sp.]
MTADLKATLHELTAYPTTEFPFISLYLDWQLDGNGQHGEALQTVRQEFALIAERLGAHGPAVDSFNADRDRIISYLEKQAPADAAGLALFACHAEGVWVALALRVRMETRIIEDRYPHLFDLARVIDDFETYAVVLADGQEARILVVSLSETEQVAETTSVETVKRFQSGGLAQMLFQRRTNNVIRAHTKDISQELARVIRRHDVQHIIIAGNDSIKGIVLNNLPDEIKEKLVDYIRLDIEGNLQSILEVTESMMRVVEHEQEVGDLSALEDEFSRNAMGVAGSANTAMTLTKGQVMKLIMLGTFNAVGGECPNCGMLRAGLAGTCPYDGAELQPIDLREAFTGRAIQQSADVQIVAESDFLERHDGVGALLRWRDESQGPVT